MLNIQQSINNYKYMSEITLKKKHNVETSCLESDTLSMRFPSLLKSFLI